MPCVQREMPAMLKNDARIDIIADDRDQMQPCGTRKREWKC
jgi:hypothetical protein